MKFQAPSSKFQVLVLCLLCLFVANASAADRITATVTVTNTAVDADTFIVNGSTRTWKDTVSTPATEIPTGGDELETTTNLVNHLLATPFASVTIYQLGDDSFRLDAQTGVALSVTGAGDYFEVTYSTQTVAAAYDVVVPYTAVPSVRRQTITDGLATWLNQTAAQAIYESSTTVSNLLGRTNTQIVPAIKYYTNANGQWFGIVSNSPAISGLLNAVTNGVWWSGKLASPTLTNGINYGNAFRSPGTGDASEQIGNDAAALNDGCIAIGGLASAGTNTGAVAVGPEANASGLDAIALGSQTYATAWDATALGAGAQATADGATAIGGLASADHTNSTAIGWNAATTKNDQVVIGDTAHTVTIAGHVEHLRLIGTNQFVANSDVGFTRYALTSLANGNNAAVPIGTNVFVQVSGPSSAFTINGIAGQPNRDGKLVIILNYTGQNLTFAHDSGVDPTAANRIYTLTGSDVATTGNGAGILIYSASASRWILINAEL